MKTKLWIALLALYIVWGSTYLAIRFAVETIPPFMHASLRFLISGAILYVWRRMAGDPAPTPENWKSTAIVGTALLLGGNGLVAWAEQTVPTGVTSVHPGGIKTAKQSLDWLLMMKEELGTDYLRPNLFRFGASSLLGDIERQLEHHVTVDDVRLDGEAAQRCRVGERVPVNARHRLCSTADPALAPLPFRRAGSKIQ